MKRITSVTVFNDAVGMRLSATYSEIDAQTGRIVSDNLRFDRVLIDADAQAHAQALLDSAAEDLQK